MKAITILFLVAMNLLSKAQLSCDNLCEPNKKYAAVNFKHGKGKLLGTDTALTNRMKHKNFELKLGTELTKEEQDELKKFKIPYDLKDTLMFYDWDILHNGKVGYFGKAVAKVKIVCKDSMIYTKKYLLNKESDKYVPNQFKIVKMGENEFILNDRYHPYMNVNYYFKL